MGFNYKRFLFSKKELRPRTHHIPIAPCAYMGATDGLCILRKKIGFTQKRVSRDF